VKGALLSLTADSPFWAADSARLWGKRLWLGIFFLAKLAWRTKKMTFERTAEHKWIRVAARLSNGFYILGGIQ